MWLYPWLTYLTIGFIGFVLVLMLVQEGHRLELALSLGLAAGIVAVGLARHRGARAAVADGAERPAVDPVRPTQR
jgi:GABA permease